MATQLQMFPEQKPQIQIINQDCLIAMKEMADNSISCILTDPPYGLHFMGKSWDKFKKSNFDENGKHKHLENASFENTNRDVRTIASANAFAGTYDPKRDDEFQEFMRKFALEALRIVKPGGHMLMFGSTRRHHRQMCGLEDAGWEIRDCLSWLYGSGFPKSHNISKSIDKHGGNTLWWFGDFIKSEREKRGLNISEFAKLLQPVFEKENHLARFIDFWEKNQQRPTNEKFNLICKILKLPFKNVEEAERKIIGKGKSGETALFQNQGGMGDFNITKSASDLAKQFDGYGTALKPAWEPIVLAMKPCDGTFAQNAEKWGQAGLNINECRIGTDDTRNPSSYAMTSKGISGGGFGSGEMSYENKITSGSACGRWPANLILDEEAGALLDEQSGISKSSDYTNHDHTQKDDVYAWSGGKTKYVRSGGHLDQGGASRFFYCAKASPSERGEFNKHPTVKPQKLLQYLLKLIMPPKDGIILDPFAGSGSTLVAAQELGFNAIGIELEKDYCEIARKRCGL
jgi:DNA modification methylase